MKKSESLQLYRNLNSMGNLTGVRFAYCVSRNLAFLKDEIESLDKALEPDEKFTEFEKERIALLEKHAEKDDKGKPKQETSDNGSQQYVLQDEAKFTKEFEALKKAHKDAVEAREKQIEEYTKLLATESEFKPHKLNLKDVPEAITTKQLNGLYAILEE